MTTIYASIGKKVQAFYSILYNSPNFSSADSTRQIELSFDIDSLFLVTTPTKINLPTEVIAYIKGKETERAYLLYGGIGTALLLSAGTLLYYFRGKRKRKPTIQMLFPNPSSGVINIEFVNGGERLQIVTLSGQVVKEIHLSNGQTQFDIADLQDGSYVAVLFSDNQQSSGMPFVLQR